MKISRAMCLLTGAMSLFAIGQASASPILYCSSGPGGDNTKTIDLVADGCISGESDFYPGGGDGIYANAGGGDPEAKVEQAILGATGTAVDIALYGKSDDADAATKFALTGFPGNDGTWDLIDDLIDIAYITVKAANSFALYDVGGANSGGWSTVGMLVKNKNNQPGVSHISFWTGPAGNPGDPDPPLSVPLPGTLLLMGVALFGFRVRRVR